jgi:Tfp pilus assembly protein PilE
MNRQEGAFTLTELILIVIFLGIFAAISIPRLNFAVVSKQNADCLARKIVTDLRRIRTLAISNAADNTAGFALNMTGSAPYFAYEIVNLDAGATIDSHIIDTDVNCTGGNQFEFGPLGNLLSGSDTELTVSAKEKTFTITIISATGMVKCTEN